jgi:hypothetical protein
MCAVPVVASVSVWWGPISAYTAEYVLSVVLGIVIRNSPVVIATEVETYDWSATAVGRSQGIVAAAIVPVPVVAKMGVIDPGVAPVAVVWSGVGGGSDVSVDVYVVVIVDCYAPWTSPGSWV